MTTAALHTDKQKLMLGSTIVELFKLDATNQGGSTYYFTTGLDAGASVYFGSIEYSAIPCKFDGLKTSSNGVQARPTITVSNVSKQFYAEILAYDNFNGSKFTRKLTYHKYLDGQPEENSGNIYSEEVFYVYSCSWDKHQITWELQTLLDMETVVCGRAGNPTCNLVYGIGGSNTTCPYDGSNGYYDLLGNSVGAGSDECGHLLTDCRLRYGIDERLPFNGFPIMGQVGIGYRR
jgi:lambda family phage minor tail protein L